MIEDKDREKNKRRKRLQFGRMPYRAKWEMIHKNPKAYDRKKEKKIEYEEDLLVYKDNEDYIECKVIKSNLHKNNLLTVDIEVDYNLYKAWGLSEDSIVEKCIQYLYKEKKEIIEFKFYEAYVEVTIRE